MDFIKEFIEFLKYRKKYWLFPVIFIIALFAILLFATQNSAIAPFIYTLF